MRPVEEEKEAKPGAELSNAPRRLHKDLHNLPRTDSNPFSLDALAIFMFRVLQRVNHPGNLDKASPNAGYVLLMFYHLYEGKSRKEFDAELVERFGALVKIPLLKSDRDPLPDPVRSVLEEGIKLYKLHSNKHGRSEPAKGSYAKEWVTWEKQLREVLSSNAEYLNSVQVPFDVAVKHVLEELRKVAKGDYIMPSGEKRKLGTIVYAAVSLLITEIGSFLNDLARKNQKVGAFTKNKNIQNNLKQAHVTLAHKRGHGVLSLFDILFTLSDCFLAKSLGLAFAVFLDLEIISVSSLVNILCDVVFYVQHML